MHLRESSGHQRYLATAIVLSEIGENVVLIFIMPARTGGGRRTLAEAETKRELGANGEELTQKEDKW